MENQLQAKDLRIGNYIDILGNIDQIEGLGKNEHGDYASFKNTYNGYYFTHNDEALIKPIPLSEEILLKCGFNKGEKYFSLNNFDVDLKGWIGFNRMVADVKVKYLHQLQNLYHSLTGDELTFKK